MHWQDQTQPHTLQAIRNGTHYLFSWIIPNSSHSWGGILWQKRLLRVVQHPGGLNHRRSTSHTIQERNQTRTITPDEQYSEASHHEIQTQHNVVGTLLIIHYKQCSWPLPPSLNHALTWSAVLAQLGVPTKGVDAANQTCHAQVHVNGWDNASMLMMCSFHEQALNVLVYAVMIDY